MPEERSGGRSRNRNSAARRASPSTGRRGGNRGNQQQGGAPRNQRPNGSVLAAPLDFWGVPLPGESVQLPREGGMQAELPWLGTVRTTLEPTAVVRSLGPPPLVGRETLAEHYLEVVYRRAVGLAAALGASAGLIDTSED